MNDKILTDEGQQLWDNIDKYNQLLESREIEKSSPPPRKPPKKSREQIELDSIKMELKRMIKNSEMVIQDCDEILSKIQTKEEYIVSDAKVAKRLHQNLILRLQRILDGSTAFDHEIKID